MSKRSCSSFSQSPLARWPKSRNCELERTCSFGVLFSTRRTRHGHYNWKKIERSDEELDRQKERRRLSRDSEQAEKKGVREGENE